MTHSTQTHDFNPGFGPEVSPAGGNGFGTRAFWTAAIPDGDVQLHLGAGTAELNVSNLSLYDYPKLQIATGPNWQTALVPATVSFDVVWSSPVTRRVSVTNGTNGDQFAGQYMENQATVTWSASNASGFTFTSNPGNFSTSVPGNAFAELGHEGNGTFFQTDSSDTSQASASAGQPSAASLTAAAGSPAAPAVSRSALPGRTALDAAALVGALGGPSAVPATAPPPLLAPFPGTGGPGATPAGSAQPTPRAPAPDRWALGTAPARAVDQVFADLDGSALSGTLGGNDISAWAV